VHESSAVATILFTDIEGSTRLWDTEPERMRPALARHDAIVRGVIEGHRGTVVKLTGDGVYAAFTDPLDAIKATLEMQFALADPGATDGVALRVRCGLHTATLSRAPPLFRRTQHLACGRLSENAAQQ
jgi:class 3 adenylate cyclase